MQGTALGKMDKEGVSTWNSFCTSVNLHGECSWVVVGMPCTCRTNVPYHVQNPPNSTF